MRRRRDRRFLRTDLAVLACVALVVLVLGLTSSRPASLSIRQANAIFTVGSDSPRTIPAGFLGLSLEYPAVTQYAGTDPAALNPVFTQLVRNLVNGGPAVLRIGGDSADWTWWPVAGVTRPPGVTFTLTPAWLSVAHALSASLKARLILGINLEADSSQLASAEAQALIGGVGSGYVRALQLGNEPELYSTFPWYRLPDGRGVPGRPHSYDFSAFLNDFTQVAGALPNVPLAGPTVGGPGWMSDLPQFLDNAPRLGVVTIHRYPLQRCFVQPGSPQYPTIANLLASASSTGLADTFVPYIALARKHGLPLRIDELNTVSCGADQAISKSFASALWALDTLFEMARVGVSGVNVHTFPGAGYDLFKFSRAGGRWRGTVAPEYYGLEMFAQAAPPGSQLLAVSGGEGTLKVWATRDARRVMRIVVLNKGTIRARVVALRLPGATRGATVERLIAPDAASRTGVTLGGRSIGPGSETGVLPGAPRLESLSRSGGAYVLRVPAASAALVTIPG